MRHERLYYSIVVIGASLTACQRPDRAQQPETEAPNPGPMLTVTSPIAPRSEPDPTPEPAPGRTPNPTDAGQNAEDGHAVTVGESATRDEAGAGTAEVGTAERGAADGSPRSHNPLVTDGGRDAMLLIL